MATSTSATQTLIAEPIRPFFRQLETPLLLVTFETHDKLKLVLVTTVAVFPR
jgi:hypothetical protein